MSTTTRVSLEHYHDMIRRGLFEPREDHHVELIYGEVTPMSPVGPPHASPIVLLTRWSFQALPQDAVWVMVQLPIRIPELESEPEPDLVWARDGDYSSRHAGPEDVLLLMEVSDTSLARDRGLKARLYAQVGIADYWVVNVPGRCVEVHRSPEGDTYGSVEAFGVGQDVRPLAFPEAVLPVARVFLD